MTLTETRETYSWQGAVNLGPLLVNLAEDLPSHEQTGLVMQLHQLMVELPAMIAQDLYRGGDSRFEPVFRLAAALELIERIYPALDGAGARAALDTLVERLSGDGFAERVVAPAAPAVDPDIALTPDQQLPADPYITPVATPAAPDMPLSEAQAAVNAAQAVPLEPAPVVPISVPLQTPPQQDTTIYVQPNSGQ